MKIIRIRKAVLVSILTGLMFFKVCAQNSIQLQDIYRDYKFRPTSVDIPVSMKDGKTFSLLVDGQEIIRYDYSTGAELEKIFSINEIKIQGEEEISEYSFSDSEEIVLLTGAQIPFYRHSFYANYYVFDRNQKQVVPVFGKELHMAKLSPDGRQVAFVFNNNLYVKDIEKDKIAQITSDGKHASVINGMPDWVYEEEFTLKSGFEWSPDSRKVAFYRFDETRVKEYLLEYYSDLYPNLYRYKYPKAGEDNSIVVIRVYDIKSGKTCEMETGADTDVYFPRIKWTTNPDELCIIRLNRLQNKAELILADANSGKTICFYTETDEKYISEFTDDFAAFLPGNEVIIMSEKDGFQHLYRYNLQGKLLNRVTSGNWEVSNLLGVDTQNKFIYFASTEVSPLERHIYRIKPDGTGFQRLSAESGVHEAVFSSTFDFYLDFYSSSIHPSIVSVHSNLGNNLRTIESNSELERICSDYAFTKREFFSFEGPARNELFGYMFRPANFDSTQKYPLLMYVYGGPGSQEVLNNWEGLTPWFQYLTKQGYLVACIDNRGSDGRGAEFKKSTYLELGKCETEDQIAAAKYLASLGYIDKERIGIFGWSYGGYMSLLCLFKGSDVFKMGIAVAPVTNWRYYDGIYTERYMRKPQDNPSGYDNNSPLNYVDGLKGKLLLIHGMADDNVHFQNSTMLTEKLIESNKQFEMQFYPNKNHGISGGNTRYHLYSRMTQFIFDNL